MAARADHTGNLIRPSLESGIMVICDRYVDSSLAYQGAGRGLDAELIRSLNRFATAGLTPDRLLDPTAANVGDPHAVVADLLFQC